MPELPEVETTRRGIAPHLVGHRITGVHVRDPRLRWPVPADLSRRLVGHQVLTVTRRGKYLLVECDDGYLIIHLGMSGSLRLVPANETPRKHDHVDILLDSGLALRYHDPRRFGCLLWAGPEPAQHALLSQLGPEPLGEEFSGEYLYRVSRGRRQSIKTLIMDSHVVVGVGNIYANEALFEAGIRPGLAAGRLSKARMTRLVAAIRRILNAAVRQGGTTLRDFVNSDGQPGYFRQKLKVYDRGGEPCRVCETPIRMIRMGQRATCYCPHCQH